MMFCWPCILLRLAAFWSILRGETSGASMKPARNLSIVLVTAPDLKVARQLAKAALDKHLAACVNLIPRLESHYWWQGKLEKSAEVLLLFKSTAAHLSALEKLVIDLHPYDTPEFVVVSVTRAGRRYLDWWVESTR
jgi:periplasmic divalent cation tolerance protein